MYLLFPIYSKIKISDPIKSFIYRCDLFSVNVGFRFNQQREYSSITGGIFSILMILLFIAIFTNTCINTWNKQQFISIENRKFYQDPSYLVLSRQKYFFFTMGLTGIDMNSGIRYFDFTLTYNTYIKNKQIKNKKTLVPCRRQVWESFNDTGLLNSFGYLGLSEWLCPPQDDKFQISGKFTSQEFKFLKIGVQACNNNTNPTRRCATSAQLADYLLKNQLFTLNYYFINTLINSDQKQFIRCYLEDKNYFPFTKTQGLTANLYVSTCLLMKSPQIQVYYQQKILRVIREVSQAKILNYFHIMQRALNIQSSIQGNLVNSCQFKDFFQKLTIPYPISEDYLALYQLFLLQQNFITSYATSFKQAKISIAMITIILSILKDFICQITLFIYSIFS